MANEDFLSRYNKTPIDRPSDGLLGDTGNTNVPQPPTPEDNKKSAAAYIPIDDTPESISEPETSTEEETSPGEQNSAPSAPKNSGMYEHKSAFVMTGKAGVKKPVKKAGTLPWILVSVLAAALIVILILMLSNTGVTVPDLRGWKLSDVSLFASQNGIVMQIDREFSDIVEAETVISQSLEQGEKIRAGEPMKVVVSAGHDPAVTIDLPDIMAMTIEQVEKWAADNYLAKFRLTTEYSDTVPSGKVIRFEINDSTVLNKIRRDTPLYVTVSKGPEQEIVVTLPNFKEKSLTECYLFCNENGLELIVNEIHDEFAPYGAIMSQSIKAGQSVPKGTTITLNVSQGKLIEVPSFSGMTRERAGATAGELGIMVSFKETYSGTAAGRFISQSVKAGTIYERGTVVELSYSIGNKIVIPSFVGSTRDSLDTWAYTYNQQGANIKVTATYTQNTAATGTILTQTPKNTSSGVSVTIKILVSTGFDVFIPDFVAPIGSGYDRAITRAKAMDMCALAGLVPIFAPASNSNYLPDVVWRQDLPAGSLVPAGTVIRLYYRESLTLSVPNFVSPLTSRAAIMAQYNSQFAIVFNDEDEVRDTDNIEVYRQNVPEHSVVAYGSQITLYTRKISVP